MCARTHTRTVAILLSYLKRGEETERVCFNPDLLLCKAAHESQKCSVTERSLPRGKRTAQNTYSVIAYLH